MAFQYKALKEEKIVTGELDAANEIEAISYLKSNHYIPIELHEKATASIALNSLFKNHVGFNQIVDFTRQLAIMLNAGLTLVDALDILKKQVNQPSLLLVIEDLNKEIRAGKSFSESLKKYPQHFSNLYIALIKSGEASGKLNEILLKLAENLEKQRAFKGKIKGALIYPAVIIVGMISVMFIMVTFVLPKLLGLYKDFNVELPITTKILIAVSGFASTFWPLILLAAVVGGIFFNRFSKVKEGKQLIDSTTLKLPVIGKVLSESVLVDSTRTLSILISAGVSILEALNIIIETTSNVVFETAYRNVYKEVEKGTTLGQALENQGVFPPILVQMTTVGEQTGHLDDTLLRISNYFESESELAVKAMTTLIEPVILVVLGVGVGVLVFSVITPIYNLTSSFK